MKRIAVLAFVFGLAACGADPAPPTSAPPSSVVAAPAPPPPPPPPPEPLATASRAAIEAALATPPDEIAVTDVSGGMGGTVSRAVELHRAEGAFTGALTCNVMGRRRSLDVSVPADVLTGPLAALAHVPLTATPDGVSDRIVDMSRERTLLLTAGETRAQLSSDSLADEGTPWTVLVGPERGYTSSAAMAQLFDAIIAAVNGDRCDTQPAGSLTGITR